MGSLTHDVHENFNNDNKNCIKLGSIQHQQLLQRCEIVKKQTILLLFCVCSSFLYYMISAVTLRGINVLCLDIIINSICIFLMFDSAKRYWNCCTKYGFCCCCYISQNLGAYLSKAIYSPAAVQEEKIDKSFLYMFNANHFF